MGTETISPSVFYKLRGLGLSVKAIAESYGTTVEKIDLIMRNHTRKTNLSDARKANKNKKIRIALGVMEDPQSLHLASIEMGRLIKIELGERA